ncbi:MAG: type II toxin-antitoxin system RelE/ParE family toxin [Lysobacterales bacterium CG02_land_8_20_14_3_00_62_12]|nr:MAG: type II toxin-antitoxin system RelE/ParE family toxin [Xanthomonadales bacterium CG02_land_8_20_14_3_00_62_12]PJA39070.1 MAG: type II toxin-antitoxin system RelE/ParE family toxin [Xanthomonadales bacterium CG_4_9_14_3_um_filter_62_6]
MVVRYTDEAKIDLAQIIRFRIEQPLPDPVGFVRSLRQKITHLYAIDHPGRKGRVSGTTEWVLTGLPYIAVFRRDGDELKIFRVLHGARRWPTK